jgi:hypothetical protein
VPFTLAHPAAILPLRWLLPGLPLVGLIIGAMVPDVLYFIALRPTGTLGHTLPGVLLQGVPAGLILAGLWCNLMHAPMVRLLPAPLATRVPPPTPLRLPGVPKMAVAIALGACTHLLWDGFTHRTGFAVARWPVLTETVGPLPLYSLLQHGCGVLGLLVLAGVAGLGLSRQPVRSVSPHPRRGMLGVGLILGSLGMTVWAAAGVDGVNAIIVRGVIGAVSGLYLAALLTSVWIRLTTPKG